MNPNLKWKAVFILLVILSCIYGLAGLPTFPTSVAQLKDNFSHQIKLGLDLQGGTHLVLQVQVQEAVSQETDQMVDRVTTWLRGKNIHYDEVRRVADTHIVVRNADSARLEFRDHLSQQFGNVWDMAPTAGDPAGYAFILRPEPSQRV
jgi:preprotein translocase subunit SecD